MITSDNLMALATQLDRTHQSDGQYVIWRLRQTEQYKKVVRRLWVEHMVGWANALWDSFSRDNEAVSSAIERSYALEHRLIALGEVSQSLMKDILANTTEYLGYV